jgi:hypothetical protein
MADNVLIATKNDVNGAHQQVVQEFLDGGGLPVAVSATNPLPVEATISTAGLATSTIQTDGTQKTQIVDADGDAVTITGGKLDVNASVDTTGLATSAGQDTGNASLSSIDGKITAVNTGAVVISSSALPTGASTSALQTTGNTSLSTIAGAVSGTEMQVDVITMPITTVQATNLDIRDLAFASDKVDVSGSTLAANSGVDIGDVTINNSTGASAVNIQDGGNSITVDAPLATPIFTTLTPNTTGGWSTFMASSADGSTALTNSAQAIKASAGTFGGYYIYNPNTSAIYVQIYNTASGSVTVGTTNPQNTFVIPPLSAANLEITNGINYSTAMSCAATTTGGGNTAPTTALEANFWYK